MVDVPTALSADLQACAATGAARIREAQHGVAPWLNAADVDAVLAEQRVQRVLALSPCFAEWAALQPAVFVAGAGGGFATQPDAGALAADLLRRMHSVDDESVLKRVLRVWRREMQMGIIWRDLLGDNDLDATTAQLTTMAEVAVRAVLDWSYAQEARQRGTPIGRNSGAAQELTVIAMGKLGACELNLSSDIDLILAFAEGGDTLSVDGRSITNQAFFTRVAQRLAGLLGEQTADGFVFRVDLRLRPFGDSGALVASFDMLENYYVEHGRDWERYALIKARPIAGDPAHGQALLERLRPFVFRRYLDFGAIDALREMKEAITRERHTPQFEADIKLGSGGIREVEFTAQMFQLIFGGRDPRLQERGLRVVLPVLAEGGWLSRETVDALDAAYVFLRNCEHRLQALHDEQTQRLPDDALDQARVAAGMGMADWTQFLQALEAHRQRVRSEFGGVIARRDAGQAFAQLWPVPGANATQVLQAAGYRDCADVLAVLAATARARNQRARQDVARRRLDEFVPRLIAAASGTEDPDRALTGGLKVAEAVMRRSAYLALLNENPKALAQLVRLCAASEWIAAHIGAQPALLDELLDSRGLYTRPDRRVIGAWLHEHMARLPEDDLEARMDGLRAFKEAQVMRVAAGEVTGELPLMKVSDALTWCAEAILEESLDLAWRLTTREYGAPEGGSDFLIVGYGKLGGLELGPQSDLDLLFLHDAQPSAMTVGGPRPIANGVFFTRLSQRLLHILTTATRAGTLYEIDTRLRPSGAKGMMVTSLGSFEAYQRDEAWTYEHQALVRARPVAGSRNLAERFDDCRRRILALPRDGQTLRSEILAMRERMELVVGELDSETFADLKRGPGGIIDIEFMVQYLVLAHAGTVPAMMRYTDNVRILETAAASGMIDESTATLLTDAYLALRSAVHRLALGGAALHSVELERQRRGVRAAWDAMFADAAAHFDPP